MPHKLRYLNTWPPVGSTLWESYAIFKRYSLAGGSTLQVGEEWGMSEGRVGDGEAILKFGVKCDLSDSTVV